MKMKKFINAPETITDEELVGLGLAYPDIVTVDGHLVISKDLENADRVTIVTYGGSGHEPAQAGFVGKGMLDVQAVQRSSWGGSSRYPARPSISSRICAPTSVS